MIVVYLVTGLAAVAYCLYYYCTRTFDYWRSRNVRGPTPVPFFGNIMESTLRRETIIMTMKKIYDAYPDEAVVGVYRMTTPNLLIRDPDIVKQMMITEFDNFPDRGVSYKIEVLGENLFHCDEKTWRGLRNKFAPLFSTSKLRNMLPLMTARGDDFTKYVEKITRTQREHNIHQLVQKFTLATITACLFGLDIDLMNEDSEMVKKLQRIDNEIFNLHYSIEFDMMFPGMLKKFGISPLPAEVVNFFNDLVKQVFSMRKGVPTNRKDFMDTILELRQAKDVQGTKKTEDDEDEETETFENIDRIELTDALVASQSFVFYGGGYESSATTMGFLLMELARNPDIQDKVAAEIKEVLERHEGKITVEALNEMVYLGRAIEETLRRYPIVDTVQRRANANYRIPGTDLTVEKDRIIVVCINALHNDEKYWPDPTKFDPDRFTAENSAGRHPAVYMPFGIGPRHCIGSRLSNMQTRVCMVKFLHRFKLEATAHTLRELKYDPNRLVLAPEGGCKMNIMLRE